MLSKILISVTKIISFQKLLQHINGYTTRNELYIIVGNSGIVLM